MAIYAHASCKSETTSPGPASSRGASTMKKDLLWVNHLSGPCGGSEMKKIKPRCIPHESETILQSAVVSRARHRGGCLVSVSNLLRTGRARHCDSRRLLHIKQASHLSFFSPHLPRARHPHSHSRPRPSDIGPSVAMPGVVMALFQPRLWVVE